MDVGFFLTGTYANGEASQSPEDWLERVATWLETHEEEPLMFCRFGPNADEQPTLFVRVHPCAEEVEFSVPEPNNCTISAKTSSAGPGYHIYLCELLHAFGLQFNVAWDEHLADDRTGDDTGFFFSRDDEAVRQEMLHWLTALSRVVVENGTESTRKIATHPDYDYPDQTGILTPIGPRDLAWFRETLENPQHGAGFFAWWTEGVGPAFFLGRALCRLWQEFRWRPPITDDEGELLMDIHMDLERAHHDDPRAGIPWREWRELLQYLNEYFGYAEFQHEEDLEAEIQRRADSVDANLPLIGYRRGRVQVALTGGWSITIPGAFAEEWEENGETWSAWHGGRTIWFTSWSVKGENDDIVEPSDILESRAWPDGGEIFEHEDKDRALLGRAVFLPYEEDGEPMWNLKGYSAIPGNFALCNIYLQNRDDLNWALEVWKSMRNQS